MEADGSVKGKGLIHSCVECVCVVRVCVRVWWVGVWFEHQVRLIIRVWGCWVRLHTCGASANQCTTGSTSRHHTHTHTHTQESLSMPALYNLLYLLNKRHKPYSLINRCTIHCSICRWSPRKRHFNGKKSARFVDYMTNNEDE